MSKAIQSVDAAISGVDALRNNAARRTERDAPGGFSRLLDAGKAEVAEQKEAQTVPAGGKDLPPNPQQAADGRPAEQDTGAVAVAPEAASAEQGVRSAASIPQALPEYGVADTTVVQDGAGTEAAASTVAVVLQAEPAASATLPEARLPVPPDPGMAVPELSGNRFPETATPGAAVEPAKMPAVDGRPVAQVATELPRPGSEAADTTRNRPLPDPVGQAVREGIMRQLAVRTAQGNTGDALHSGTNGQPPVIEAYPAGRATPPAGIIPFSDTLLESGSMLPSARVAVPVGQPGWARAVGEQVVWFVGQHIQSASLKLHPQHLGPLELQLQMDGDRASIAFASQHAVVRDALESSLPRLRDMFAEQGLNLVNVNISQQGADGRRDSAAAGTRNGNGTPAPGPDAQALPGAGMAGAGPVRGLVDYYV